VSKAAVGYDVAIFLDTNAVHAANLMLCFAEEHGLNLAAQDWDPAVKDELLGRKLRHVIDQYEGGFWILRYLRKRVAEHSAHVLYAPVTRLELLCNGLRGQAIMRAAIHGTPNRWFSQMKEAEARLLLEPNGYHAVRASLRAMETRFDAFDIPLEESIDPDLWPAARSLLETIFCDVQDCLVYASAFVAQADEFISFDSYLAQIATWIENPGSSEANLRQRFTKVNSRLVTWYSEAKRWQKSDVNFPQVQRWQAIRTSLLGK
jgi:hypothetical protein